MKIERSCATAADAKKVQGGLRSILYLLFLVAAVMAAVGAFASARANQGSMRVCNALPANIIVVTNSGTILLTSDGLQISHSVTINGPGAGTLAVNGNGTFRAFVIFASDVTISGFTITNGFANDGNGGGGINNLNGTTTTVSNCNISGNFGGGISNVSFGLCCATLTVTNSTISDNSADYGGGILDTALDGGAFLTVTNSTISNNSATSNGGAILSTSGGGALAVASVTISNSTLSGNAVAGDGGAIFNSTSDQHANVVITNSTISGNSATVNGGGIYNVGSAELDLGNTILDAGASGGTIFNNGGQVTSLGYNLASDAGGGVLTGPGDQTNTDPMLGPLQDNGGPTFTHALLPGSPAINSGDPSFTPPPFYDQRGPGLDRVVNGRIDIGSFEVQGATATPTPTATATATPTPTTYSHCDADCITFSYSEAFTNTQASSDTGASSVMIWLATTATKKCVEAVRAKSGARPFR